MNSSNWLCNIDSMATICVCDPIGLWSPAVTAQGKRAVEVYKQVRHLIAGDYYPLFPQARSLETWDGWQYHHPVSGEGMAAVFRLRYCDQEVQTIRLQGLELDQAYRFVDPFGGEEFTADGRQLLEEGLKMSLPANGAELLRYSRV